MFEQAIIDFDLQTKTFTFVVRDELSKTLDELRNIIVDDGYVF